MVIITRFLPVPVAFRVWRSVYVTVPGYELITGPGSAVTMISFAHRWTERVRFAPTGTRNAEISCKTVLPSFRVSVHGCLSKSLRQIGPRARTAPFDSDPSSQFIPKMGLCAKLKKWPPRHLFILNNIGIEKNAPPQPEDIGVCAQAPHIKIFSLQYPFFVWKNKILKKVLDKNLNWKN